MSIIKSNTNHIYYETNYDDHDELKERFYRLLSDGRQIEATSPNVDINKQPDYLNFERFKRAQSILQKYYINLAMGSTTGLILLLQIESIYIPLIKTGKSRTVSDNYDRYTSTAKYIRILYETDFFDKKSDGWKYINLVRSMHQRVFKLMMKEDANLMKTNIQLQEQEKLTTINPDLKNIIWVNQYDMALTQFAFIGLFVLYSIKCGAYKVSEAELSDIVYYWRIISYYFGIEERFNLFVYHDDLDKQINYLKLILNHINEILDKNLDRPNSIGLKMSRNFMFAFEDFNTTSSLNILDHWWFPDLSLTGSKELIDYSFEDKFKVILFLFYFKILFKSEFILKYINFMYKRKFDKFCEDSVKIKSKLEKKYKDQICEL